MDKSNPLEDIKEFYDNQVEEQDEKGFAELFKQATKAFIKNCKKEGFTLTKIEYLDGYYIFGRGTNSVIHFRIKEIPEWKFGIWWTQPDGKRCFNGERCFNGVLFTQFEANIDKFKPTASAITENIFSTLNEDGTYSDPGTLSYEIKALLKYMKKEPYLAYYRDATSTNFNYKFVSRETAKNRYIKAKAYREKETKLTKQYHQELISYIYKVFKDKTNAEVYVYDRGDGWHPRYEILGILPDEGYEQGTYAISDWYDTVAKMLEKKKNEIVNKAKKEKIYYDSYDVDTEFVYLLPRDKFEKLKERKTNEKKQK